MLIGGTTGTAGCLSDEAIGAFMNGALGKDARRAVEGHIVGCDACRGIVADAAFGVLVKTGESAVEPAPRPDVDDGRTAAGNECPRSGDVIADKYVVVEYLGSGSMGWVVAARHRDLGLRVAIKVLRSAGPEAARRFLAEAQICARLSHPHIPRVFDIGRLPGGAPYIVMEYLVGQDLAQIAATGPVPIRDAVRWVMQACGALAEAHAAGIVHRDLKPANLFLAAGPGEPAVKVLDFGISKVATPAAADSADGATATGTSIGSPLYMSPEQIRAHKNVDPRSDIWSLGVILYQLTTGRAPFRGPGLPALAVAIAVDPPPRPSALRQDLPPKLERIILRCLAKSPDDRYAQVTDLVAALASLDQGTMGKPSPRGRGWALAAGLATALAAVVGTAVLVRRRGTVPPAPVVRVGDAVNEPMRSPPPPAQVDPNPKVTASAEEDGVPVPPLAPRPERKHNRVEARPSGRAQTPTRRASPAPLGSRNATVPSPTNVVGPLDTPD